MEFRNPLQQIVDKVKVGSMVRVKGARTAAQQTVYVLDCLGINECGVTAGAH